CVFADQIARVVRQAAKLVAGFQVTHNPGLRQAWQLVGHFQKRKSTMSEQLPRRDFVKRGLATAGVSLAANARILGANDRIRAGVIGPGKQGRNDMGRFIANPDVEIVALCDVYAPHLELAKKEGKLSAAVPTYKDFREVLDRKDVDAVIVATPDHWHALMTIEACKAGKDVYVEKPACVAVEEGRK